MSDLEVLELIFLRLCSIVVALNMQNTNSIIGSFEEINDHLAEHSSAESLPSDFHRVKQRAIERHMKNIAASGKQP